MSGGNEFRNPWAPPPPSRRAPSPRQRMWRRMAILGAGLGLLLAVVLIVAPPTTADPFQQANIVKMGAFALLLMAGIAASGQALGAVAAQLGAWLAIMLVLVGLYAFRAEFAAVGNRVIAELLPSQAHMTAQGEMSVRRGAGGHFRIDAEVDGRAVRFLIDTGATDIVLSPDDARRLGFDAGTLAFTQLRRTANGLTRGAPVRLASLRIGELEFSDVAASVNEGDLGESLLGMEFLNRLSTVEMSGDVLTLRP